MSDVARLAGVSHMTVSRVLNQPDTVRPDTRERVETAIAQLGYRRNSAARSLVTRRSQTIGVVCFDTTLYGPASTLYGIEQAAQDAGYFVSVASLRWLTPESVRQAADRLVAQSVEAIVVIAPQKSAAAAFRVLPTDLPVVAVEGGVLADIPSVSVDQALGARYLVEHLLAAGHPTVHHVRGPADWFEATARAEGWRSALEAAGRPVPRTLAGDWSARSGYEAGQKIARRRDVSAVFVANDQMALGMLRALHEAEVRVPADISVVGFDDIPESAYFTPPLTTVRQPFDAVGRGSIRALLDQIERPGQATAPTVIAPRLVVRDSTAPPRPAAA
jgi:DNA-binding LacI/PurR family transcriptional regulator